ncbi:MAG: exo-beta-N-acetylmuramidase NamZ domain-containing protein, partial [Psychroflexus sp.]
HIHLVDSLLTRNVNIKKVFAPEHGFRGKADAGEIVKDGIDTKTNLPIVSLYGNNKKPKPEQLLDIDLIIFDIQDVGARFYTYISTLHYTMEACAENNVELLVFDRPNPNGHYIDGPILEKKHQSFVGMHEIPIVHGLTIGEYAQMING